MARDCSELPCVFQRESAYFAAGLVCLRSAEAGELKRELREAPQACRA